MKKIIPGAARSPCPSYDVLIQFADTGMRDLLEGHDPTACLRCAVHLEEYQSLLHALRELKGSNSIRMNSASRKPFEPLDPI